MKLWKYKTLRPCSRLLRELLFFRDRYLSETPGDPSVYWGGVKVGRVRELVKKHAELTWRHSLKSLHALCKRGNPFLSLTHTPPSACPIWVISVPFQASQNVHFHFLLIAEMWGWGVLTRSQFSGCFSPDLTWPLSHRWSQNNPKSLKILVDHLCSMLFSKNYVNDNIHIYTISMKYILETRPLFTLTNTYCPRT